MEQQPIVSLSNIVKTFGAVRALNGMSLDLYPGEVHILLGENGAGKSTLVNILLGNYQPDSGKIIVRGSEVVHHSPAHARKLGINVVLQDFSLAPTLSVTENLFLGRELKTLGFVNHARMRSIAREKVGQLGGTIDPDAEVGTLPRAEQQLVEITKGLLGTPGILLLDEPTAAISEREADRLFKIIDRLRDEGWALLYITHRMEEVRRLGDRVTVMRDGRFISTHTLDEVSEEQLITDMVGRELAAVYPEKAEARGEPLLEVEDLSTADGKVAHASLRVCQGEIVAVAGLVGSGKSELAKAVLGLIPVSSGSVAVGGRKFTRPNPREMIQAGIGFMPEDRRREALALDLSVQENIALEINQAKTYSTFGLIHGSKIRSLAQALAERLDIRPRSVSAEARALSGGNQQKVVLARALTRDRKVFVVAEPTSGVDVGARQEIYANLRKLCSDGAGVLMISSDLEEVVGLADRVYVMNGGRIQVELAGNQITNEAVVAGAFGHAVGASA
ncbi:sugar ABC transporter ATP-binding protein [Arthrobacter sp. GCM10027362]|uniref:sugar ABC transporter ATP-binding protein n=1 Tax=Arthrobacter sp. GCM10027362 TaxID=3273379 RepID=UPI003642F3D6